MPRGIPNKKPEPVEIPQPEPVAVKMETILLKRHYCPVGKVEIVGHHTKEIQRKNAAGEMYVAMPSVFVAGQKAPPPFPGVGFDSKIWADTVIRLEDAEARDIVKKGIGERAFED
jgi:hypothetical protein